LRVVMQRDTVPTGACTDVVFGEVEDYVVTLTAGGPVVPTLTLSAGPVSQSVEAAAGATSAVVSWVAPTAVSTCPGGAVTVVRTVGPASGSAFPIGDTRVVYTLDDACANHLDVAFTVTVRAAVVVPPNPGAYCSVRGSQPWEQWIGGVAFGSSSFVSSKDGYALVSTTSSLAAGSTVSIGLTPAYSYFTWPAGFKVWLDANRDGVFAASEVVFEGVGVAPRPGTAATPLTGSFVVPATAVAGSTRLRVVMQRDTVPTGPCTDVVFGEVEDYAVTLA
jgi:GEVED domain/HYR domain